MNKIQVLFNSLTQEYFWDRQGGDLMAKMTVYHGGFMLVEHPEIRIGRNTKDFGTGFIVQL